MSSPVDAEQLRQLELFADVDPALRAQLAAHSTLTRYDVDEIVFHEGEPLPARLYVLVTGTLRIAKMAESGKETILRLLSAGDVFAAPALFGDGQAPATATAIEPVSVLTLKREALLQGIRQDPELALQLLVVFNKRLQRLHSRLHGLVSERAIVRLVNYLDHFATQVGTEPVAAGEQLRSRLTYYQIARSIGITYEECVRLFRQLRAVVSYQRGGTIVILDRAQLRAIAIEAG